MDKEVKPQDTDPVYRAFIEDDIIRCEYSGLRSVEGYKEDKETYRIDKEKIDSLMDTLHEIDEMPKEETKKGDINFMYKWIRERSGK